jgi:hypothetical protein
MRSEKEIIQLKEYLNGEGPPPDSWSYLLYDEYEAIDVLMWILEQE